VSAIGETEVQLRISGVDRPFVDDAFMERLRSAARERVGRELAIHIDFSQADLGGGCIAASVNGRIVYDNTYSKRLERMRNQLRTSIVRDIIESDE